MDKYYIYRITNNIDHKTYIGQHKYHKSLLVEDGYMGSGTILKKAQKKYGIENFTKEIITIAMSMSEANVLEKYYIAKERKENTYGCYNIADGGQGGAGFKGHHHSEESNNKNREKHLGKIPVNKGKKLTDEQIKNISEKSKGKNKGKKAWNKGLHKRFSNGTLGKHWELDMESKNKISETLKSKHRHWYTNGTKNVCSEKCPEGFWEGRTINGRK